jgi:hypothetical protein
VLAVHVLYVVNGQKSRASRSLKDNPPPVPEILQLMQVPLMYVGKSIIIRNVAINFISIQIENLH